MSDEFGIFYGNNLFVGGDPKEPIIENIIYDRDVVCLIADPGVGKSVLALQLLFSLTSGEPFLDVYAVKRKCNVLYLQTEGDRAETIERMKAMKLAKKVDYMKVAHLNLPGIHLNTDEGLNKFLGYANQAKMVYDVIIVDPMYTTVRGSMNNDEVAGAWVMNLRKIREVYGCAFIVLHHDNKEQRSSDGEVIPRNKNAVFGSVFWGAFFNSTFKLHRKGRNHILVGGKQRSGKIVDGLELEMCQPFPLYYREVTESDYGKSLGLVMECVYRNSWISADKVIKQTELSRGTVYGALRRLRNEKKIIRQHTLYSKPIEGIKDEDEEEEGNVQQGTVDKDGTGAGDAVGAGEDKGASSL